jgi:DNA replication protein DnaC
MIKKTFSKDCDYGELEIVEAATRNKPKIFDDFCTQKFWDGAIETWFNIINIRYMENMPTVFTSNLTLGEIAISMSDRISSRLASGVVFELKGNDKRIPNKKGGAV